MEGPSQSKLTGEEGITIIRRRKHSGIITTGAKFASNLQARRFREENNQWSNNKPPFLDRRP